MTMRAEGGGGGGVADICFAHAISFYLRHSVAHTTLQGKRRKIELVIHRCVHEA